MRYLPLALALLLVAPLACAQVYKWTDAKGTVHYSQTPPTNGTKYSIVELNVTAPPAPQPQPPTANDSAQAAPTPATRQTVADTPANRAKLCDSLQSNLAALSGSQPVVMQVDGQQKLIDSAQRQQQLANTRAEYQRYCSH